MYLIKLRSGASVSDKSLSTLLWPAAVVCTCLAVNRTIMSAKHHDRPAVQQAVASANRPNHQLHRSITEQSPPFKQSRVHHYLHRKERERIDRMPMSAGPATRGSLELSRADPTIPSGAADTGTALCVGDDIPNASEIGTKLQRLLDNDHIAREQREKAAAATTSLRKSLLELTQFSNATIARLDETYSSVLQRLSSLQATIAAMKELAVILQDANKDFTRESHVLVNEIESQLGVYDQSTDQKERIQDLQARIHAVRTTVQGLSQRVDTVRERVEDWEKADKEWQERTRRRLKAIWIFIFVIAFIVIFLFIGAQYAPSVDVNQLTGLPSETLGKPTMMENLVQNGSKSAAAMADEIREELARRRGHEREALRVFDEL
ncbi:hypothetical protein F4777DRAFT_536662 [Nemania sp. FL0916]|nr:hypothetical protein F4777DRAFT_536662 [Nemania sp. FL0916]